MASVASHRERRRDAQSRVAALLRRAAAAVRVAELVARRNSIKLSGLGRIRALILTNAAASRRS